MMPKTREAEAPDLRIVPTKKIIPHEIEDVSRAQPLIRRLPQDGVLRNPPVVTMMNDAEGHYVILDGTNRVMALDALKYPHTLVQVVQYEEPFVELLTWNHVVVGMNPADIEQQFCALPGLEVRAGDAFHAKASLARKAILAYVLLPDGKVLSLAGGGLDAIERTRLLQEVVDVYVDSGRLHRTNLDQLDKIKSIYPDMGAAIIFPHYEPIEILELAEAGLPVPTGITRHVIHGRAMRLNYPLERLADDRSLDEKNAELTNWVREQFNNKSVRYYAEATFLFDE